MSSQSGSNLDESIENFRNADMDVFILLEKGIPRSFLTLMYLMTYLATLMCCFVAWWVCLLSMDVIVARSGRVSPKSHRSEPTIL